MRLSKHSQKSKQSISLYCFNEILVKNSFKIMKEVDLYTHPSNHKFTLVHRFVFNSQNRKRKYSQLIQFTTKQVPKAANLAILCNSTSSIFRRSIKVCAITSLVPIKNPI